MKKNNIIDKLQTFKGSGKPVIGCFPLYPPLELLHAMGLAPVVLWGLKESVRQTSESDQHLQTYACSVARHLTQFLLAEGKGLVDGIFMYNACDTLRNLPEIFMGDYRASGLDIPVIRMHIPMAPQAQTNTAAYFEKEIRSVIDSFQSHFSVSLSEENFFKSQMLYNRMKKLALEAEQAVAKGRLSFLAFSRIMQGGWFLPIEDQIKALESLVGMDNRLGETSGKNTGKNGVILSGILPPPESVISAIEHAGLTVAGNDIAALHRVYADIHDTPSAPVDYYKKFYLEHYPCPTLLYAGDRRVEALMDLIDKSRARGVIFVGEKFCEYEYFEYPYLEKCLKEKGIYTLQIEIAIDDEDQTFAHTARIEAFAEMIK